MIGTARKTSSQRAMRRALVLARKGMGSVRPNPPVGAVVVREGRVVGEGFHHAAGTAHAETLALERAGSEARGADLHVTLEPCNHQGKTPPCVPQIIRAGVARVFYAVPDPNRKAPGGLEALAEAGVEVHLGPCTREAAYLVAGYRSREERNRPRVFLKVGVSIDGRLATPSGDSKWITSEVARAWVHRRRREADAILVGADTVVKDNPQLTTRHVRGRSPDRFVVDSRLRTPVKARVWNEDGARRVAVTTEQAPEEKTRELSARGVEVWTVAADENNRVVLPELVTRMGDEGYTTLFVEGGGNIAGAFFQNHLVDCAWVAMSRRVLLGGGGPGWTEGLSIPAVARAIHMSRSDLRRVGPEWLFTFVPEFAQWWDPETAHV